MSDPDKATAERWALADDEHLIDLLAWRVVKARIEAGGFNGLKVRDFGKAREALKVLTDEKGKRMSEVAVTEVWVCIECGSVASGAGYCPNHPHPAILPPRRVLFVPALELEALPDDSKRGA